MSIRNIVTVPITGYEPRFAPTANSWILKGEMHMKDKQHERNQSSLHARSEIRNMGRSFKAVTVFSIPIGPHRVDGRFLEWPV